MPVRRPWLIAAPLMLALALAAAWSALWYFATGVAERRLDEWRAQEARSGRIFTCGSQTIGGFPFRVELRCVNAAAELRSAPQPTLLKLADIVVVAQVWDPTLLIAEFSGPLAIGDPGKPPSLSASWKLARASVRGTPAKPERISVTIDGGRLDRIDAPVVETLALADRVELHSSVAPESAAGNHTVDVVVRVAAGTAPLAPFGADPLDADIAAVLRGLKDLRPKPTAVWLRELQASGATLEVTRARLKQGEALATATGTLTLSAAGRLDGALRLTVAGVERYLPALGGERRGPALGLERAAPALNTIDRAVPGLSGAARTDPGRPKQGQLVTGFLSFLGERTELEGKRAVALPLRFSDGKASLGPIPLGQVPPLY
jgi:hypothetical protein